MTNKSTNVVRLPTAARRMVQQPQNKAGRAARAKAREGSPFLEVFQPRWQREADRVARVLQSHQRTPETYLLLAILEEMDLAQRARVTARLATEVTDMASPRAVAFELARTTCMNVGQLYDLSRAIDRLETTR